MREGVAMESQDVVTEIREHLRIAFDYLHRADELLDKLSNEALLVESVPDAPIKPDVPLFPGVAGQALTAMLDLHKAGMWSVGRNDVRGAVADRWYSGRMCRYAKDGGLTYGSWHSAWATLTREILCPAGSPLVVPDVDHEDRYRVDLDSLREIEDHLSSA